MGSTDSRAIHQRCSRSVYRRPYEPPPTPDTPRQVSLVGYVLDGLGCANIAPALFSLAGSQNRMPRAIAITTVSTLGFAGILAGPALIGFAANHFGLIAAFVGVAMALLPVAVSTRWLRA